MGAELLVASRTRQIQQGDFPETDRPGSLAATFLIPPAFLGHFLSPTRPPAPLAGPATTQ